MKRYECLLLNKCDSVVQDWEHLAKSTVIAIAAEVRFGGQPSMDYFLWEFTRGLYYSHGDVEFASKHAQFYNSNSFLKKFILSI